MPTNADKRAETRQEAAVKEIIGNQPLNSFENVFSDDRHPP
jgi:hypothetical protein